MNSTQLNKLKSILDGKIIESNNDFLYTGLKDYLIKSRTYREILEIV